VTSKRLTATVTPQAPGAGQPPATAVMTTSRAPPPRPRPPTP
jgi:hypothetical protein